MEKFTVWWHERNQREQLILLIGSLFVSLFILISVIIIPIKNHLNSLSEDIESKRELVMWMKKAETKISTTPNIPSKNTVNSQSFLGIVSSSLENSNIDAAQIQQDSRGNVNLKIENIAFDQFLLWLVKLQKTNNIAVQRLNASKTNIPGKVSLDLVLTLIS